MDNEKMPEMDELCQQQEAVKDEFQNTAGEATSQEGVDSQETCQENQKSTDAEGACQEEAKASADEAGSRIESLTAERDEYIALVKRVQADFENYRRRNNTAVADAYSNGMREAVKEILPVLDNLERAVEAARKDRVAEALSDGVEKVLKQFKDILEKMGLEEIDALQQNFDPEIHNAVMQVEAEEGQQEGMVVEVFQKGYKMKEKVLRYSMVKVAK